LFPSLNKMEEDISSEEDEIPNWFYYAKIKDEKIKTKGDLLTYLNDKNNIKFFVKSENYEKYDATFTFETKDENLQEYFGIANTAVKFKLDSTVNEKICGYEVDMTSYDFPCTYSKKNMKI